MKRAPTTARAVLPTSAVPVVMTEAEARGRRESYFDALFALALRVAGETGALGSLEDDAPAAAA